MAQQRQETNLEKSVRLNITMPRGLLNAVKQRAKMDYMSFSGWLQLAAKEKLERGGK